MTATPQDMPTQEKAESKEQKNEWKEKYVRLYAEFENTKKRMQREQHFARRMANKNLILDLLSTLDDLERAISNLNESEEATKGLQLILTNLQTKLTNQGVQPITITIGQEPNPHEHHVLTKVETPNTAQKGKIVEVITKGYTLHDQILRHAQVIIGA